MGRRTQFRTPPSESIAGRADLRHDVGAQGERSVKAVGDWVEKQPVLALLIALGVGYVGARAFLR